MLLGPLLVACGTGGGGDGTGGQVGGETSDFVSVNCGDLWLVPETPALAARFGLTSLRELAEQPLELPGAWDDDWFRAPPLGSPPTRPRVVRPAVRLDLSLGEARFWNSSLCGFHVRVPVTIALEVEEGQLSTSVLATYETSDLHPHPYMFAREDLAPEDTTLELNVLETQPHRVGIEVVASFDADPPTWAISALVLYEHLAGEAADAADPFLFSDILLTLHAPTADDRGPIDPHVDRGPIDPYEAPLGGRAHLGCYSPDAPLPELQGRTVEEVFSQAWEQLVGNGPVMAQRGNGATTRVNLESPSAPEPQVCLRREWDSLRVTGLGSARLRTSDGWTDVPLEVSLHLSPDGQSTQMLSLSNWDDGLDLVDAQRFDPDLTDSTSYTLNARIDIGSAGTLARLAMFPTYATASDQAPACLAWQTDNDALAGKLCKRP